MKLKAAKQSELHDVQQRTRRRQQHLSNEQKLWDEQSTNDCKNHSNYENQRATNANLPKSEFVQHQRQNLEVIQNACDDVSHNTRHKSVSIILHPR